MPNAPMTLELEMKPEKPHSRFCIVTPLNADGSGKFNQILGRTALLADVRAGDSVCDDNGKLLGEVVGVKVLDWYE